MANYFNTLNLRQQLAQLGKCRFMGRDEFADGASYLQGKKVVIVGCGAQGLNQGLNMRDSGLDISYALRKEAIAEKRASWRKATENGFKVGTVRSINYNYKKPGHVTVEVEVDKEMRIPKGSKGELVTEMLGTVKMNLLLNDKTNEFFQPGDTLPGITNNGLMGVAEEKLVPQVEQLLPKMDSILQSLNKLLADPALTATIHNAERLTANLDVTTRQLNSLMNNELPQITGRLVTITDNFSVISENLKGIDYASTFSKVDSTLYNVQLLTEKLTRKDNTIGLLFNDPTFYQNLSTTTANAASLLEDLKAHPKRYVHFSLFGKKDK